MVLFLLLLVGLLLAVRMVDEGPVELLACTLLGALAPASLVVVGLAWLVPTFAGPWLLAAVAGLMAAALLATGGWRRLREWRWRVPRWHEALVLAAAAVVAGVTWLLHTDAELLLSLASWLHTGEAECFYMQTFSLVGELNPAGDTSGVRPAWEIVNSPGNVVYTAPLMATLESATFRVVDVLVRVLLFLFVQLLLRSWTGRRDVALLGALFAVFNPFVLSVEVLDRNLITAALSAALLLALRERPDRPLVHGVLLGLVAISGLRLLPICFGASVLAIHAARRSRPREYGAIAAGFLPSLLVVLPHLRAHGLRSMGETEGLFGLFWLTLAELPRTPLLPFPTGVWYLLQSLDLLGVLACGLALAGAAWSFRRQRAWTAALVLPLLGMAGVLSVQRDWVQGDKLRIALEGLVPLVLLAGWGCKELIEGRRKPAAWGWLAAAIAVTWGLGLGAARLEGVPDAGTGKRHPVYQTETEARLQPARRTLRGFGLLPDYSRLATKLEVGRKRRQEAALRWTLFGPSSVLGDRLRGAGWWGGEPPEAPPQRGLEGRVGLEVDLALLPTDPAGAVRVLGDEPEQPWFVDLTERERLIDVYYRAVAVPWQSQELTVTALPLRSETWALGELNLDLNAFAAYGRDPDGFVRVGPVHHRLHPGGAPATAMTALPDAGDARIAVRLPEGFRLVVRDWLVNGLAGTPHRVDSWLIEVRDGQAEVRFLLGEPESYL